MLGKIARALWGDLSQEEFKKFGMLSLTFLFIIGTYWLLRPLKDGVFMSTVGAQYIPNAKMLSFICVATLIFVYSKLVDMFKRHQLFYIICSVYAVLFLGLAMALKHPTIGLANTVTSPSRLVGWITYLSAESLGSLVVPLFWSFVASTTETGSAKKGYGLIIAGAQIGSISGPALGSFAEVIGIPRLMSFACIGLLSVPVLIYIFVKMYPSAGIDTSSGKKRTGFVEGLRLLFSRSYLMGILGVATLYEIVGTILDYQFKSAVAATYATAELRTQFASYFGMSANFLALIFAFIGTSFFIRRFGLTFCLVMFPIAVGGVVLCVWQVPVLWVLFGAMVTIKGLSYALNNPCKEIMYIPTSKDVKFKAKGWIDGFGGRSAKATGSGINKLFGANMNNLLFYGSLVSLGIIGFWIVIALYVGRTNKKLTDEGRVVE